MGGRRTGWRFRVIIIAIGRGAFGVGVGVFGLPFFEDAAQLILGAEQANPLAAVTHAGFQNPPFAIGRFFSGITIEAFVQFISFDERFIEELCVVKFEGERKLDTLFQLAVRVLDQPIVDGPGKVVFADEGFADDEGVSERGGWMSKHVLEIKILVRRNL